MNLDILKSLEQYTIAQKIVGNQLLSVGLLLIVLAGLSWFFLTESQMYNGFKIGCLIAGIFLVFGGSIYRYYSCPKVHNTAEKLHQSNSADFTTFENERMKKVFDSNPKIKTTIGVLVLFLIGFIVFSNFPFWNGVTVALVIMLVGVFIVETLSYSSIQEYYKVLITFKE